MVGGLVGVGGSTSPAQAANCLTSSRPNYVMAMSFHPDPCNAVQVRMYRYIGSSITTLYGAQSYTQPGPTGGAISIIEYKNGTNAGNAWRYREYSIALWTSWKNLPYNYSAASNAGSTSDELEALDSWASEAADSWSIEAASSPLERAILADDEVTPSEYREANEAYAACVSSHGWNATIYEMPSGAIGLQVPGKIEDPAFDADAAECRSGTVNVVGSLYLNANVLPKMASVASN